MKKRVLGYLVALGLAMVTGAAFAATATTGTVYKLTITASNGLAQVFTKDSAGANVKPCSGQDKVYAYFYVTEPGGSAMHRTLLSAKLSGQKVWLSSEWSDGKCWVRQAQIR